MNRRPAVSDAELKLVEQLLGVTLDERERMLLVTRQDLLGALERQDRFVLAASLIPLPCPSCQGHICQRSAYPEGISPGESIPDDSYRCPRCQAPLTWNLAAAGYQYFTTRTEPPASQREG